MIPPEEPVREFVDVNGVRLFVRTVGAGPAVIVLHGGPGAHHDYLLPQYDALADGRCLRYYDQRGGGQSPVDRQTPVGWREHVADLLALLELWGYRSSTIVGYSWGAMLAMLFALEHTSRVSRLALVSPAAATIAGRAAFNARFADRMNHPSIRQARSELQASGLRASDPDTYRKRAFELSVAGYFRDPKRARDMTPFRVTGRTQEAVWDSLGDFDLRDELATLKVPALVLHGTHDPMPIDTARETASLLGAEFVEFPESGHAPHVEETGRFLAVLDAFLPKDA